MNTSTQTRNRSINPRHILGGILGSIEETDFELEKTTTSVASFAQETSEAAIDLFQTFIGVEPKKESNGESKFSITGSINFTEKQTKTEQALQQNEQQNKEKARVKAFFQALKADQERTRRAKDNLLIEEEINDIATNLPTDQKNQLLHYQASYKDRSIYQKAELRKKLIELRKKQDNQEKQASIPSPAKQPSALEGAFEGRSGQQGSGTANLSAHATG